jgi:hypothetical protein
MQINGVSCTSITWGYPHQKRGRGSATARCSGWRSAKFECVDRNFFTQRSRKNDDGDIRTDAPCEFQRGQAIEGWTGGIRENQISSVLFKERQKCGLTIDPRERRKCHLPQATCGISQCREGRLPGEESAMVGACSLSEGLPGNGVDDCADARILECVEG